MNFSAALSSSLVVTPCRTLPASRFIVLTRIAPAAAIRSISSGVFLMINARRLPGEVGGKLLALHVVFETERRDHGPDVVMHIGRTARPVDPAHQPLGVVVVDQG